MACLRQARPNASVQDICDALRAAGNNASNPDNYNGYGIPDMVAALNMIDNVIEETTAESDILSVFPNPSRGDVKVILNQTMSDGISLYGITLYGITGQVVMNTNDINELESALNSLSAGVFSIKVDSEKGSQTVKVVICK